VGGEELLNFGMSHIGYVSEVGLTARLGGPVDRFATFLVSAYGAARHPGTSLNVGNDSGNGVGQKSADEL
jgi:hypothetical protein